MPYFKNIILKSILTYSLSNREVFTEKVSAILQRYQHDEEKIKEISDFLFSALSDTKQNINDRENITQGVKEGNKSLNKEISELTKAIEELKNEIKHLKK